MKTLRFAILCVGFWILVSPVGGREPGAGSLFGLTNLSEVHLEVVPEEWAKLQPPTDIDWDIFEAFRRVQRDAAAGRHFHSERSSRPGLAGYLGVDHQFGKADVTLNGETVRGVGLRYKGNGTFLEGRGRGKFSFKIDFNEYDPDQEFRGLTKINLHNNISDPSMLREALSYELFREAGIPCPRVGWARVTLTLPGQFTRKDLGLYSLVEQVDKRFLKERFGSARGLLLKPSTFGTFRYLGEDWASYKEACFPKTEGTPEEQKRVMAFARLLHLADDATFDREVEAYLDMDVFLRFLAVTVLLSNLDSFLGGTQNYYAYLEPQSRRIQIWPWDMDHSFGAFPLVGTAQTRSQLSIHKPHWGNNRLIDRVLQIPRCRQAYEAHLRAYLDTLFAEEKLRKQVRQAAEFIRPHIPSNGQAALARFERLVAAAPPRDQSQALMTFVVKRRESVARQLDGLSEGQRLKMEPMRPFKILGAALLAILAALALNFGMFLWALIAGFKGGPLWGLLNLFFYPVAPMIYGFGVRRDLGFRAAVGVCASLIVLILTTWLSLRALL